MSGRGLGKDDAIRHAFTIEAITGPKPSEAPGPPTDEAAMAGARAELVALHAYASDLLQDATVARLELAALKARRCDTCQHGASDTYSDGADTYCHRWYVNVPHDHACNEWRRRE